MAIAFNADEVFKLAEDIERDAVTFYRRAAEGSADEKTRLLLLELAEAEVGHAEVFANMRKELPREDKDPLTDDPYGETALYLQYMAQAHAWEGKASIAEELTGKETPAEILDDAIRAKKDSVLFYLGVKDMVFGHSSKEKVEEIIREEIRHITQLSHRLAELRVE